MFRHQESPVCFLMQKTPLISGSFLTQEYVYIYIDILLYSCTLYYNKQLVIVNRSYFVMLLSLPSLASFVYRIFQYMTVDVLHTFGQFLIVQVFVCFYRFFFFVFCFLFFFFFFQLYLIIYLPGPSTHRLLLVIILTFYCIRFNLQFFHFNFDFSLATFSLS